MDKIIFLLLLCLLKDACSAETLVKEALEDAEEGTEGTALALWDEAELPMHMNYQDFITYVYSTEKL